MVAGCIGINHTNLPPGNLSIIGMCELVVSDVRKYECSDVESYAVMIQSSAGPFSNTRTYGTEGDKDRGWGFCRSSI